MDSADAAASPLGAWAWIRGYFTPATLFLFVNLVIGTIALTSRFTEHRRRSREHYYHHDAHGHAHHFQEQPLHAQMEQQPGYGGSHYYHPEQTLYAAPPPPAPTPLARTSSVLDRLRSLGLYRFRSGDFPPEFGAAAAPAVPNYAQDVYAPVEEETAATAHYARSRAEPAPAAAPREDERMPAPVPPRVKKSAASEVRKSQVARAVPRAVAAVAQDDDSVEARAGEAVGGFRRGPSPLQQEYHYQEEVEYVPPVRARAPAAPAPLQRAPSVLERLRSFGLYGFLAPDQPAAAADGFATPADEKTHAHAHYDRSRSEPAPEQQGKKVKKPEAKSRMAKASSEARKAPAPRPAEAGGGECVNARAEAFIDSFRQQQQQQGVVHHYQEPEEEEYVPPPAPLPRTSSVLDRLRSFSLYRFRSGDLGPDLPTAGAAGTETNEKEKQQQQAAAQYGRSRSEPAKKKKQEARIKSSSSSAVEEAAETEECVDARADDFINKFRQQLQLQRLNSLLNYKEMLGGGGKQ